MPAAAVARAAEFHLVCGKFCVEAALETRKALEYRTLPGFEPKRSKHANALKPKGLARGSRNNHQRGVERSNHIKYRAISTVGGER